MSQEATSETDKKDSKKGWLYHLWPIERHELPMLLPMFFMLFLICFNYSILRNLKDSLVVTAKGSGAEVIPFIKLWVMLPAAFLMTVLYTRLASHFKQEKLFYTLIGGFLLFFLFFTFIFYPNQDILHPQASADALTEILPTGFRGFIAMYRNWTFTLFYVASELWGVIVLTVLFWGFANQVTGVKEAKRFYAVFTVGGNLAAIAAGWVSLWITGIEYQQNYYGNTSWEQTLVVLTTLVVLAGLAVLGIFRWAICHRNTEGIDDHLNDGGCRVSRRKKRSLRESFRYLSQSKYLLCVAVLVIGYNLGINLVEVVWKDRLREMCPNPADFNNYMNTITVLMGVFSTFLGLISSVLFHKLGWRFTALITPITMLFTSAGFFLFLYLPETMSLGIASIIGTTPLAIAVFFGGMQNCLCKATKYSVFDSSKEMAFIPLPIETKLKGKAAIDGVGSRLSKSGGSVIHQSLIMLCGTLLASSPYIAVILGVVITAWIAAVKSLNNQFLVLAGEKPPEEEPEQAAKAPATVAATATSS